MVNSKNKFKIVLKVSQGSETFTIDTDKNGKVMFSMVNVTLRMRSLGGRTTTTGLTVMQTDVDIEDEDIIRVGHPMEGGEERVQQNTSQILNLKLGSCG